MYVQSLCYLEQFLLGDLLLLPKIIAKQSHDLPFLGLQSSLHFDIFPPIVQRNRATAFCILIGASLSSVLVRCVCESRLHSRWVTTPTQMAHICADKLGWQARSAIEVMKLKRRGTTKPHTAFLRSDAVVSMPAATIRGRLL